MKLDTRAIRYLTPEDWRVLTAVEMGSRNHEIVPTPLITQIAGLRGGSGVHKSISALAKVGLIAKVKNAKYDGYRLTYGGLDYLALHTHKKQSTVYSVGNQIGVGKESDIYVVASPTGRQLVLKIHRLGRISFRTVKANRDYLRNRSSGSWMYMSRLAAMKEFAFMKALRENGFPVPEPISCNRHTVVMGLVDAFPLRQIASVPDPAGLYAELMSMILRLARYGLIHGDFNEFNILIEEKPIVSSDAGGSIGDAQPQNSKSSLEPGASERGEDSSAGNGAEDATNIQLIPTIIDFPQMLSIDHPNAEFYFKRDVDCIRRFFERRFQFVSDEPGPFFEDARKALGKNEAVEDGDDSTTECKRLDVDVEATGFSRKMAKELEKYMKEVGVDGDAEAEQVDRDDVDQSTEADEADNEHGEDDHWISQHGLDDLGSDAAHGLPVQTPPSTGAAVTSEPMRLTIGNLEKLDIQDIEREPAEGNTEPPPIAARPRKAQSKTAEAKAKAGWSI